MNKETKIIRCHGIHGPDSLFAGDCWTISYVCGHCGKHVGPEDTQCQYCDYELIGIVDEEK